MARRAVERGDLDDEFVKAKGIATPGMVVYKQKILHGESNVEKALVKKKKRIEFEQMKMDSKIQKLAPELVVCFFMIVLSFIFGVGKGLGRGRCGRSSIWTTNK